MLHSENFKPVLRFAVMSDIHYKDHHSVERERFELALRNLYAMAKAAPYQTLDALAVVGDFTDQGTEPQMAAFADSVHRLLLPETHLFISIASHEFKDSAYEGAAEKVKRLLGKEVNEHGVIHGFHFISMSPSREFSPRNIFEEDRRRFMLDKLDKARADDPAKPIFTFQHPHIPNTVYGSVAWADKTLTGLYDDYPQVINFSGHSHAPINDPRSIHQNAFTSLNTGTLSYFELDEFDKIYGTCPPDKKEAAQLTIVEADENNRVRILLYDLLSESFFPEVWRIDEPSNRASFLYTEEKRKKDNLPFFPATAALSAEAREGGVCVLTIPQAEIPEEYVNDYDVAFRDRETGEALRRFALWSGYYLRRMPEKIVQEVDGLIPGKTYEIEVIPRNFYGRRGKTKLSLSFTAR